MENILKVLILISLLKNSFQIKCTKYQERTPSPADLKTITREVTRENTTPLLGDYKNVPNGVNAMTSDLKSYKDGMENADSQLTISQLVEKYGYKLEQHKLRTSDGYILTLHRIPGNGKAVYIQHGIFGSSIDFFMAGKDSLPYLLSNQGYDVWLGNARGNQYSRIHVTLSPVCAEFWDYSFDEIGYYDLPASIDYIVQYTGKRTLSFVGYSSGTTAFFVMASLKPQYNNIVTSMVGIAPMAWMTHARSPILKTLSSSQYMEDITKPFIGSYEFAPKDALVNSLAKKLCANTAVSKILCKNLPFLITGFDSRRLNMEYLYSVNRHHPGGGSSKELYHFAQEVTSGQFRRYDNDASTNIDKYGLMNPPSYPLSRISTKVSLIFSNTDWLSNITDTSTLISSLPNVKHVREISGLDHLSFIWGKYVKELVFDQVVTLVNKYGN